MTTVNTDERLKQIRERWATDKSLPSYHVYEDIDFLLALLDSQADPLPDGNQHYPYCARHKGGEYNATLACTCYDYPLVAATRMRDKCVEKAREVLDGLMIELPQVSDSYLKGQGWNAAIARANNELMVALPSLTLDSLAEKGDNDGEANAS